MSSTEKMEDDQSIEEIEDETVEVNEDDKVSRHINVQVDSKNSSSQPLINIDAANYMLRGLSRPASGNPSSPPTDEDSSSSMDEVVVCEAVEAADNNTTTAAAAVAGATTIDDVEDPIAVEPIDGLVEEILGIVETPNVETEAEVDVDVDIDVPISDVDVNIETNSDDGDAIEIIEDLTSDMSEDSNSDNDSDSSTSTVSTSFMDVDDSEDDFLVDTATVTSVYETAECWSLTLAEPANFSVKNTGNNCARVSSFHNILCFCQPSCCCNCGTSCSPDCHACFHAYCARFFANDNCQRDESLPPVTLDYDKPVAEWTSHNVVEWMAALNLYPYSDVFRCKDIKGSDLIHLDREKLIAMGIKDEFHQKAILTCIDELLHKPEGKESPAIEAFEPGPNLYNHNLRQHSFSNLERCDKCNKYLRGVLHQGFLCLECGFVAHRTCAAIGLPSCTRPPLEDNRTPIFQFKSYFGQALCAQFRCSPDCPAPLLLIKFIKELENRAKTDETLELYTMYSATPPADQVNKLVKIIDTDLINIDLNLFGPTAITGVVKKYLRELPDPIIPVQWYDKFIEAQKKKNDEECTSILKQLVMEMPDHHKSTLHFMMSHLCRICQMEFARGNKCPPTVLVQVMCHIFLRPPWERIIQVVYNTQAHNRIIELLLLHCDWGEILPAFASAPAIPPRKVSGRFGRYIEEKIVPLQEAEWYWGNIKREDVNEMLNETIDGTFLVRDASSKGGEYTLTLRKGGANKLIKICHRDGKYGFTEPYTFSSVVELINHFRNVSLSLYNTSLNIKLLYPVARGTQDDEAIKAEKIDKLVEKLVMANEIFSNKQRMCEQVAKDFNEGFQDVQTRKHALNALKELVKVFEIQSLIQEKFQVEAQPHETKSIELNSGLLKDRLKLMQDSCDRLDLILQKKEFYNRVLERRLTCLKPEILNLRRERERYVQWLQKKGYSPHKLSQIINRSDGTSESDIDLESLPHNDQSTWLIVNCSREDAERMLKDKPDGTFLIRKSTNLYKHVLVVVCNGIVNHCIINETKKGCGFSEPYNIYRSLKDLVLHYATNSLEIHNDLLNTVLKHPIGAPNITIPQLLPTPSPQPTATGPATGGNTFNRDIPIAS